MKSVSEISKTHPVETTLPAASVPVGAYVAQHNTCGGTVGWLLVTGAYAYRGLDVDGGEFLWIGSPAEPMRVRLAA